MATFTPYEIALWRQLGVSSRNAADEDPATVFHTLYGTSTPPPDMRARMGPAVVNGVRFDPPEMRALRAKLGL